MVLVVGDGYPNLFITSQSGSPLCRTLKESLGHTWSPRLLNIPHRSALDPAALALLPSSPSQSRLPPLDAGLTLASVHV